jgi:hypothetical protein
MKYLETFNDYSHICPPVDHIKKARDKKAMAEFEREREEEVPLIKLLSFTISF